MNYYWLEDYTKRLIKACMRKDELKACRELKRICDIIEEAESRAERKRCALFVIELLEKALERAKNDKQKQLILQAIKIIRKSHCR